MSVSLTALWTLLTSGDNGLEIFSGLTTVCTSVYAGWQFFRKWRETKGIRAVKEALEKEPELRREHREAQEKEVMLSMLDRAAELGPLVRERLLNRLFWSLVSILLLVVAMYSVQTTESPAPNHIDLLDLVFALFQLAVAHSNRSGKWFLGEVEQTFFRNTSALQAWFYETHVIPAVKDFNRWASGQNLLAPYIVAEHSAHAAHVDWVRQALVRTRRESRQGDAKHQWKSECLQCGTSVLESYGGKADLPTEEWLMVCKDKRDSLESNIKSAGYQNSDLPTDGTSAGSPEQSISCWKFPVLVRPPLYVFAVEEMMFKEAWSQREGYNNGKMTVVVPNIRHLLSIRMEIASTLKLREAYELEFCEALLKAQPNAISQADWVEMVNSFQLPPVWLNVRGASKRSPKQSK